MPPLQHRPTGDPVPQIYNNNLVETTEPRSFAKSSSFF